MGTLLLLLLQTLGMTACDAGVWLGRGIGDGFFGGKLLGRLCVCSVVLWTC